METLETVGNGEGNTNSSPSSAKRCVPSKRWCFTAYKDEMETLETKIKRDPRIKYGFGREIAPSTGREHSQGFIECEVKIRPVEYFRTKTVHWEKSNGTLEENIIYCSKDGKYVSNIKQKKPIKNPMAGRTFHDWQNEIVEILQKEPHDRNIYCFVDPKGGAGKSSFAKHIVMTMDAISVSGKGHDVKCAIQEMIKNDKEVDIVLWDIPRCVGGSLDYTSIEAVKNGLFFSGKYESGMCLFNIPHVIVFSNVTPKVSKLTEGRFVIRMLSQASEASEASEAGEAEEYDEE